MPRKSVKSSTGSASRSSSKRPAPQKTPTRQSKRVKATPIKSSYFEVDSEDDKKKSASPPPSDKEGDYGAERMDQPSESDDEDDAVSSDEDARPKKKTARGRPAKQSAIPDRTKQVEEQDLWRPGAKLPSDTQVIIKKPKAREAGDTPYENDTIHPNTLLFLKDLAANNDRKWFKMHDPDYRASLQDFTSFLESLTLKVVEADETIPELPVKDIIMRIYRDIRFSKDKTPYKTAFAAAWSRTGRKGPYAAYYLHIQPKQSFVGGGLWCPSTEPLGRLRRDIDRKPYKIKRVLADAGIRKEFFGGIPDDEKKAVHAFTSQAENASTALKSKPKGYESDHKDIELLRLRSFTIGKTLSDDEVVGAKGLERVAQLMKCMVPFITYLNSVVMPDEESSGSDEEEGEGDDNSGDE
ncbi:hypothetical protein GQ43DRAFT_442534 [Delitschia confertaspora ATCC 74209]|uniref:DUF2461 domain-containing protein n=1 Tax=Delitschia confertaspora ATCC 74209 TaxID=1513339 RepID=A0A9P4JHL7_9PLEO|nr:hypothetical protein GQ43DRAFT_442534 [Delitschia confertaspora ATCC 74209]